MRRQIGVALLAAAAVLATAADAWAGEGLDARATGDHVRFDASRSEQLARDVLLVPPAQRLFTYQHAPLCREVAGQWTMGSADGTCPAPAGRAGVVQQCQDGDTIVMPMWRQSRDSPTGTWSDWQQIDSGGCGIDLLPVLTEADFRRLPIPAPTLTLQPDRGWVLVNIETITYTDPTPITLHTELLGHGITVQATPTTWTYDYGDGHTLTTTSPGHPHPHHDVFHRYEHPGHATITLTAQWTGRYQIDGHPTWPDITGTATTTTTSTPFTIEERTSRLVADLCTHTPHPPDC